MQDVFIKRSLKRIREKTAEKEMWVGGKFVSETHMREVLKLKEPLGLTIFSVFFWYALFNLYGPYNSSVEYTGSNQSLSL